MNSDSTEAVSHANLFTIAFDSTKLISADSFLFETKEKDPRAKADFQLVVNAYCNETAPYFPAPKSGKKQPNATELLKLWQRSAIRNDTVPVSLEDDELFASMAPIFAEEFGTDDKAADLLQWIKYQFSNSDLVEIFWQGGNQAHHLEQALDHIAPHIDKSHPLSKVLNRMQLQIDARFYSRVLNSNSAVAKAYTFFAFKKGRDYVYKLPEDPKYIPHWIREAAQPTSEEQESSNAVGTLPRTFFPWGDLLVMLMSKPEYGLQLDGRRLVDSLSHIRAATIKACPYKEVGQPNANRHIEDFVVTTLRDATKVIPPNQHPSVWLQWINPIALDFTKRYAKKVCSVPGISDDDPTIPVTIETVRYSILLRFTNSAMFHGRRIYNRIVPRSQALERYVSPPIRQTVKKFVSNLEPSAMEHRPARKKVKSKGRAKGKNHRK